MLSRLKREVLNFKSRVKEVGKSHMPVWFVMHAFGRTTDLLVDRLLRPYLIPPPPHLSLAAVMGVFASKLKSAMDFAKKAAGE